MKKIETLPLELRKLGLTEKEVRIYLAALELGYTSVQEIAKRAQISRPTTYEIIKSLESKELISQSREKGKRYFIAQSPDYLLGLLRRQKRELEEKEREFIRIIAALRDKYSLKDKREIKVYKGKAGLSTLFDDFLTTQSKKIYVLVSNEKIWPARHRRIAYQKIRKRLGKIKIKELSTAKDKLDNLGCLKQKSLKQDLFSFTGNVIIYDKLMILQDKQTGLIIENKPVIDLIKSLFLFLWQV